MDPLYTALDGHISLTGYAPDGDSVRFLPRDGAPLSRLRRAHLIRTSPVDGSVQIRLDGVDAPEIHYASAAQPRGPSARDALLAWLGVERAAVSFAADGATISACAKNGVPVTVLANSVDPHGRPIAYILPPRNAARAKSARWRVTADVVRASANHALVENGDAYFLAYQSLPFEHRRVLREAASKARRSGRGIWRDDATARGFALRGGERAIGPTGALIFPKLFRRAVDWISSRRVGFQGSFIAWLATHGSGGAPRPDRVSVNHAANLPLSALLSQTADRIALTCDVLDLVFTES